MFAVCLDCSQSNPHAPWQQKLNRAKKPQVKVIDKAFAGIPANAKMYISTPQEIDAFINTIPRGRFIDPKQLRDVLAKQAGADATCPVSTGIFLRIVAEAAYERHAEGAPVDAITPFWRVIEADSALCKKLACTPDFVAMMRDSEKSKK